MTEAKLTATILKFRDIRAISDSRLKRLLSLLQQTDPAINSLQAEFIHFVKANKPIDKKQHEVLKKILTYGDPFGQDRSGKILLSVPRAGTISPWSSKATSIARNVGLDIERIERGIIYYIGSTTPIDKNLISRHLHDRMTETVYEDLDQASEEIFRTKKPGRLITINVLEEGISALKKADQEMGLALSDEEIKYLAKSYAELDRNPTDLELMMFGVVNSEHCRHKIFNADWYIDGKKQPKSLFKMIKNTYKRHAEGVISAYSDNSAILAGHTAKQLEINPKTDVFEQTTQSTHLVAKVETHNHPTAIAPFPGAATGSGGEIRDENATGRGAKAKMGLTGFSVSNLRIPGLVQPWEKPERKSARISSPLEIMIKGPIGGASFNNEFGRPNTAGYFRTYEAEKDPDNSNDLWGYHKPIMVAGGVGQIKDINVSKKKIRPKSKLIVLGGPAMLIGLAGGSASSMEAGQSDEELDFASVQRGNAEMQRRAWEVISRCTAMDDNPITTIHDVGAGGLSNALTELVHDSGLGAKLELRKIDSSEPGLSPMEIWCNEAQERYVLAIDDSKLKAFEQICLQERCPFSVVGEATSKQQLVISDSLFNNKPADIPMSLLFGGPPKIIKKTNSYTNPDKDLSLDNIKITEAIERVLQIPSVGSKKFLITIGDRSVGGLVARDQMIGPWQVPVSDCAVSATSYFSYTGEAMAMGERTPLATIDAAASARMAIAEAITNIAGANINKLSDIN